MRSALPGRGPASQRRPCSSGADRRTLLTVRAGPAPSGALALPRPGTEPPTTLRLPATGRAQLGRSAPASPSQIATADERGDRARRRLAVRAARRVGASHKGEPRCSGPGFLGCPPIDAFVYLFFSECPRTLEQFPRTAWRHRDRRGREHTPSRETRTNPRWKPPSHAALTRVRAAVRPSGAGSGSGRGRGLPGETAPQAESGCRFGEGPCLCQLAGRTRIQTVPGPHKRLGTVRPWRELEGTVALIPVQPCHPPRRLAVCRPRLPARGRRCRALGTGRAAVVRGEAAGRSRSTRETDRQAARGRRVSAASSRRVHRAAPGGRATRCGGRSPQGLSLHVRLWLLRDV